MKISTKEFRVREGDRVHLKKLPTKVKPFYKSDEHYKELLAEHIKELSQAQGLLYALGQHSLLLIFQAMDAAGKDGAIKHVMSGVNPQGCQVFSFKHPSAEELAHDFLWRTTRALPERGRIGIFNRSYYEEVLIVRVHPEILKGQSLPPELVDDKNFWDKRYRSINDLEKHLYRNGTRVIKFFLHLSKEEQRQRFLRRLEDPERSWKFSKYDLVERALLEGIPGRLRRLPGRHQHRTRAVVRGARRRQAERPAHHLPSRAERLERFEHGLSQARRSTLEGTTVAQAATGEVSGGRDIGACLQYPLPFSERRSVSRSNTQIPKRCRFFQSGSDWRSCCGSQIRTPTAI